jgi:hypothetical protein
MGMTSEVKAELEDAVSLLMANLKQCSETATLWQRQQLD